MLVNGRLTARPRGEAAAVTNSVLSEGDEDASERQVAKANTLEIFVQGAGSRFRFGRTGGRARRLSLRTLRQTVAPPACASHRLSPAREAARS